LKSNINRGIISKGVSNVLFRRCKMDKPITDKVFENVEDLNSIQPPPMSIPELVEKLEKIDPGGKEALKSAREMFER